MPHPSSQTLPQSIHRSIEACATWQRKWEEAEQPQCSNSKAVFERQDSATMDVDDYAEPGKDEFAEES